MDETMTDGIPQESTSPYKWVGTRPIRPDGVPKVTGRAQYGSDLAMPGMLVGRILRSPHAHARIRSIDTSKAAALPGVKAVITSADFPDMKFEYVGPERVAQNFWHITRNVMAREKALYEGHPVAAIAAISKSVAEDATALPPGATVLLYTDGLVERRDRSLEEGLELLRATVESGPSEPDALVEHVLERLLADGERDDDVALLARSPQGPAVDGRSAVYRHDPAVQID